MLFSLEFSDGLVSGDGMFETEQDALAFVTSLEVYGHKPIQYTLLSFEEPAYLDGMFPPEAQS